MKLSIALTPKGYTGRTYSISDRRAQLGLLLLLPSPLLFVIDPYLVGNDKDECLITNQVSNLGKVNKRSFSTQLILSIKLNTFIHTKFFFKASTFTHAISQVI